jgi:hypothetical protein
MRYILETKDSARAKWRPVRFGGVFAERAPAIAMAADLDAHGNACRVRSTGHVDGMDRTEFSSISGAAR